MTDSLQFHDAACQALLSFTVARDGSNSCPVSRCCYLTISSSATPFSICPQSFPASGSFPMSQLFASGSQSIGASASKTVLPMNIQGIIFKNKKHLLLGRKAMTKLDSILKGRQHFANRGPYSQSYGFSSSYVQM